MTPINPNLEYPDELIDELAKEIEDAITCSLNGTGQRATDRCVQGLLALLLKKATIKIGNRIIKR